jgi:hypothetical protein
LEQRKSVGIVEDMIPIGKKSYGAVWNRGIGILESFIS